MSDLLIYQLMQQRMGYLSTRQSLLAGNIANANTPGYKAQDVEKPDFASMVQQKGGNLQPERTHPGHLTASGTPNRLKIGDDASAFEMTRDGNTVNLEDQMLKMNDTNNEYRMTTTLYRKMNEMMRNAISTNN